METPQAESESRDAEGRVKQNASVLLFADIKCLRGVWSSITILTASAQQNTKM